MILLKKSGLLSIVESLLFSSSTVATFLAILTLMVTGQVLSPTTTFMVLSFMNLLRITLSLRLGNAIPLTFELFVSFRRIESFLLLSNMPLDSLEYNQTSSDKENLLRIDANTYAKLLVRKRLPRNKVTVLNNVSEAHDAHLDSGHTVHVNGDVKLTKNTDLQLSVSKLTCKVNCNEYEEKYLLQDVSFQATEGCLIAITGQVGSGKSTLLAAIAGEVIKTSGDVFCSGTMAYVPQTAWVFPGTLRENVLFGEPYEEKKYAEIIDACALREDINRFSNSDLSFVGEHGVALSGGQRARINLARAVYADADVYLLDNPLSAVDAKVGEHIFTECVCKLLKEKIVILVTYAENNMKAANRVVVLHKGFVIGTGSFYELQERGGVLDSILGLSAATNEENIVSTAKDGNDAAHLTSSLTSGSLDEHLEILDEDMATGQISAALYWDYFRAGIHPIAMFAVVVLFLATQG